MEDRINEVEINDRTIKDVDISLTKVIKSVCKIINENKAGTGFLIKLYKEEKELNCLMTNEHVITKEMIELNKIIDIKYNCEEKWIKIKLDENERYIIYNKEMDVAIIEIKKDEIKDKYFLKPNINNNIEYKNKEIYIDQYPEGNKLSYSEGKIININNNELIYDASTKSGSSGSPILLKNTTEVIGMHKQGNIRKTENYGTLIYSIIRLLKYKKKIYDNGNYYIGEMLNDNRHGKGILYYKNGNIKYEGEFVNGKKEGEGTYTDKNGNYYSGHWSKNKKNGKGKLCFKNNNILYEGDFVNDKFQGIGKYIDEDGDYYIGQWLNDKKHGKGKEYYKNGDIKYDGEFFDDKYQG